MFLFDRCRWCQTENEKENELKFLFSSSFTCFSQKKMTRDTSSLRKRRRRNALNNNEEEEEEEKAKGKRSEIFVMFGSLNFDL